MDFGNFINAFGNGYSKMENTRNIESDEPQMHNKKTFCRELLCQITDDNSIVLFLNCDATGAPRSLSAYESFYRNNQRRSLRPIAEVIINGKHLQEEKFKQFLGQYFTFCSKEKVLNGFDQNGADVSMDTLAEDITREFVSILNAAAAEPDNRRTQPALSQQTNINVAAAVDPAPNLPKQTLSRLYAIVSKLIDLSSQLDTRRNRIAKWLDRQPLSAQYNECPDWQPFHSVFLEFQSENTVLIDFCEQRQLNAISSTAVTVKDIDAQLLALSCSARFHYPKDVKDVKVEFSGYSKKLNEIAAQLEEQLG